jgi:beta-glucosidase
VDVRNTGKVDGAEVVQVYVGSPLKELKAFDKVYLKAGESKKVEIALDKYASSH